MESQRTKREWLQWLGRGGVLVIWPIFPRGGVLAPDDAGQATSRLFLPIIIFWIMLGSLELILVRWIPDAGWHGGLQVVCDIVVVTGVVYSTGIQDSYFISLYLLVIIVVSILFTRQGSFLTAAGSLTLLFALEM